jgi:hypothetical protein
VAGLALILGAGLISLLAAASLRLRSPLTTLLAAYVAWVANLAAATLVLSPFREMTRGGLAVVEVVLLLVVAAVWWLRGRPRPELYLPRLDRLSLVFLVAILALLAYELVLALTVPANNWDAVTYHLPRVVAWIQHRGVYWVPNAPTDRINDFQPLAEQQIAFLFLATGSGLLYALPQYLAQLAILGAVYGAARRLGFAASPSTCAACLLATFGLLAYEASTAQNDLVAASVVAVAGCLLLDRGRTEAIVAGFAAGLGLGVKLTTILAWPVLIALAVLGGRRIFWRAAAGATVAFVTIACWTFVRNLHNAGHLFGQGRLGVDELAWPSWPRTLVSFLSILYTTFDLSVLWPTTVEILTAVGLVAGAVAFVRSRDWRESAGVALPFLAPALMIVAAGVVAAATGALGEPVRGPGGSYNQLGFFGGLNNTADEDYSAFGPIGGALIVGAPVVLAAFAPVRRIDRRQLVLAAAFPTYLILLALPTTFNYTLTRFLLVPAVLTAPLLAHVFTSRATTGAYIVVALFVIALGVTRQQHKRLFSSYGVPWDLSQPAALAESGPKQASEALALFDAAVPPHATVGAVLSEGDPSYVLGGETLSRRVVYLPLGGVRAAAERARARYVVVSVEPAERSAASELRAAGWSIRPLAGYWLLAEAP